jgi:hypothetical protein
VLHIFGYGGLLLLEALSVGTSMTAHSGGVATAALVVGLLGSVPTANHFAGHLFDEPLGERIGPKALKNLPALPTCSRPKR